MSKKTPKPASPKNAPPSPTSTAAAPICRRCHAVAVEFGDVHRSFGPGVHQGKPYAAKILRNACCKDCGQHQIVPFFQFSE